MSVVQKRQMQYISTVRYSSVSSVRPAVSTTDTLVLRDHQRVSACFSRFFVGDGERRSRLNDDSLRSMRVRWERCTPPLSSSSQRGRRAQLYVLESMVGDEFDSVAKMALVIANIPAATKNG